MVDNKWIAKQNSSHPITDKDGNFNKKNLFRADWKGLASIAILLFLVWAYKHDVAACEEVIQAPEEFCNAWCEAENKFPLPTIKTEPLDDFDFGDIEFPNEE